MWGHMSAVVHLLSTCIHASGLFVFLTRKSAFLRQGARYIGIPSICAFVMSIGLNISSGTGAFHASATSAFPFLPGYVRLVEKPFWPVLRNYLLIHKQRSPYRHVHVVRLLLTRRWMQWIPWHNRLVQLCFL